MVQSLEAWKVITIPVLDSMATMANPRFFEDLSARISARLTEVLAATPAKDMEKNVRSVLSGFFSRIELVTREEFEIQQKVLARTREKLEKLESRLAELDGMGPTPSGDPPAPPQPNGIHPQEL